VPVKALTALAELAGVGFVNLQGGPAEGRAELASVIPRAFEALGAGEPLLDEFAAAVAATDILVTADTMAAHLAGAMGHKACVLVPAVPHFYWGLNRDDCPWYPTLRLFRQQLRGRWGDAIDRVAETIHSRT